MQNNKISVAAFALLGLTGPALAADLPSTKSPLATFADGEWLVSLAIGPQAVNQFPGSKTYTVVPTGSIDRYHPGDPAPFHAPDDGFSIAVFDTGGFKAGPVARFVERRGLSDGNGNFVGLHNVHTTLELGGFIEFWAMDFFRTRLEVRQAVNGHNGLEANFAMDGVKRVGPWTFSAGPRFAYGSDSFMSSYFSVSPAEAAINGRVTPFQASAGFDMVGAIATARYDFNSSWNVTVFGGYNRLVGDAGASPISINLGSRDEFTGGATIGYTFAWNKLGIFGF